MRFHLTTGLLAADLTPQERLWVWYYALLLISISLVLAFALTIVLVRISRRFRQTYLQPDRKPTVADDVWKQHRLPPEPDQDSTGQDTDG